MVKKLLDIRLGQRLRMLRKIRRLTQKALAEKIGISFQQLQKNEKGDNQISCSRLTKLAEALDVKVDYFFSDFIDDKKAKKQEINNISDIAHANIKASEQKIGSEHSMHSFQSAKNEYKSLKHVEYKALKQVISDDSLKLIGSYESLDNPKLKSIIKELIDILVESQHS